MADHEADIAKVLQEITGGDRSGYDRLIPLIYSELRDLAGAQYHMNRPGSTLRPTALVNEAYQKITRIHSMSWTDKAHFLAHSATIMRRLIIEEIRADQTEKRGHGWRRVTLEAADGAGENDPEFDIGVLNDALDRLAGLSERQATVVQMKFFAGATNAQVAEVLEVSLRTVESDWTAARAWLRRELTARADAD